MGFSSFEKNCGNLFPQFKLQEANETPMLPCEFFRSLYGRVGRGGDYGMLR